MDTVERYFRALGWKWHEWEVPGEGLYQAWEPTNDSGPQESLPNLLEHFPSFKKWVLEEMEGQGYKLGLLPDYRQYITWMSPNIAKEPFTAEIKNGEILEAAVIAATNYLEGEKE